MARDRELENKINSTGWLDMSLALGSLISGLLLITPAKSVGFIGVGTSIGGFATAIVLKKKNLQAVQQHVHDLVKNHQSQLESKNDELIRVTQEVNNLSLHLKKKESELKPLQESTSRLIEEYKKQENLLGKTKLSQEKATQQAENCLDTLRLAIKESAEIWQERFQNLSEQRRFTEYEPLKERVAELVNEGLELVNSSLQTMNSIPSKVESINELIDIFFGMNDKLQGTRIKLIQSERTFQRKELIEWDEEYEALKEKSRKLIAEYQRKVDECNRQLAENAQNAQAIIDEFNVKANGEIEKSYATSGEYFQYLKKQIAGLEDRIALLSKPLEWRPATRADMKVANVFIKYFEQLGVILDRSHSDYETHQAILWFFVDRNQRLVLADELNEHCDKLQALAHTLNSPKFALDPESGLIKVVVQLSKKPKADVKDIDRLWVPASQFEKTVKGWSRVRLTGGSESGKSPTAENLAIAILKNRPGVAKLYNPQHNSQKNYWSIPVEGTSHADSEKGIASLAKQVDARANGQESRDVFELSIFDEVDSSMSHCKGKKSVIGGNVNFIIKQASHQNLGALFIGQNANVSEYPGMDRSDWNSAVNVHIGANAYDAITNSNRFTADEVSKLKQTADKITEFCNDKNTELGLEKTDPQAYRFALVIEPNKKPYFIELPAFGTYTFDQLQQHQYTTTVMATVTPVASTQSLEPLQTRIASASPMDIQSGYVGSGCPTCNSANRVKAGRYQGRQRYQCKDCGKRYTEGE